MTKRKYKKGRELFTFEALLYSLNMHGVVYLRDKVFSRGWVLSMQFRYLSNLMNKGLIKRVVKTDNKQINSD